jgi:dihydroorotase-like cyclic amidohydrolase
VRNRWILLAVFATACTEPRAVDTKVIVGATLVDGVNAPVAQSVIIIREGRISAVGPQQSTPIPAGSEKVNGMGKYIVAANREVRIEPGAPADLLLVSPNDKIERRMVAGKWVDK